MDDEQMIRELAGEIFWYLGYEVEVASNGDEALALYQKSMNSAKPFDAVILDLTVRGGMGGKETIQHRLKSFKLFNQSIYPDKYIRRK